MINTRTLAGLGVAGALLFTGGCGKAAEKIAERATEEAIENNGGLGDVDIKDGGVSFETEDGSYSYDVDDEGNVVMKGPDGEVVTADADGNVTSQGADGESTFSSGDNAELPEDWPAFLALPDDAKLISSMVTNEGDQRTANVSAEIAEGSDIADVYMAFKEALADEGFEAGSDNLTKSSSGDFASVSGEKGDQSVNVSLSSSEGEPGYLTITVTGL